MSKLNELKTRTRERIHSPLEMSPGSAGCSEVTSGDIGVHTSDDNDKRNKSSYYKGHGYSFG